MVTVCIGVLEVLVDMYGNFQKRQEHIKQKIISYICIRNKNKKKTTNKKKEEKLGLDVYFHHTKQGFNGDQNNNDDLRAFTDSVDNDAKESFKKKIEKPLAELKRIWDNAHYTDKETGESRVICYQLHDYNRKYFDFVVKVLKPIIAANYDFKIDRYTEGVMAYDDLKAALDKEVEMHYEQYDAYFRKVNFLFAYFENKGKMLDQWFAFVDKEDVDDIIEKCELVLSHKEQANTLLPTQAGFFFGSTDYNDWYYSDVKDCLRQMKSYRKLLKDGVTGYVIFSW